MSMASVVGGSVTSGLGRRVSSLVPGRIGLPLDPWSAELVLGQGSALEAADGRLVTKYVDG